MKRIAVIAYSLKTSVRYADRLRSLFGSCVEVASYALEKGINAPIQADVALISAHSIYGYVEEKLAQCQYLMIADLTLYQEAVDQLRALPRGSRAMLVNSTMEMAVETIRLIHNAGIKHIEMTPFYPGIAVVPDVPIAITPGEFDLVPPDVPQIVDLKDRTLSMHTVINLAAKLGMTDMLQSPQVQTYAARLATKDSGIGDLIDRMQEQKKKLVNRLKRLEGQIRGIQAMVEQDAYCNDILIQSAAVNAAINAFNKELLASHIRTCVARDIREGKDEVIDELVTTIQKLMR